MGLLIVVGLIWLAVLGVWSSASASQDVSVIANPRLDKVESDVEHLATHLEELEEKVEMIAVGRWCEKTFGCYFDEKLSSLSFADQPHPAATVSLVNFPGVPNELRHRLIALHLEYLTLDPDFLVSNLDGLPNLESLTLSSVNWVGNFTLSRAYLPKLRKFAISSPQFGPDNAYLEGNNLKSILFFDKVKVKVKVSDRSTNESHATAATGWRLDEIHKLAVDVNVNNQFILSHKDGVLTSYRRPIESLLNNIKSSPGHANFKLKYLYLSSYNLSASTRIPNSLEYLGLSAVNILGRRDLNSIVRGLHNLSTLDVAFINPNASGGSGGGAGDFKFDLSALRPAIKTLKLSGIELTQSQPAALPENLQTVRWFNVRFDGGVMATFSATFKNVANFFVLFSDAKALQYKVLKCVLETNARNIVMPEFVYRTAPDGDELEVDAFLKKVGVNFADPLLTLSKVNGTWAKGSSFNFWRDI